MSEIKHVSDTAAWVAHYRALETERADALFRDPLAARLAGERGRSIAQNMHVSSMYVRWNVVIRTAIIDRFLSELVSRGVDTVVNLGAGLDTRPYRLSLPSSVKWIEVDFPDMIDYKNKALAGETPRLQLERVAVDLTDRKARREFFERVGKTSSKIAVITEGVLPYLKEEAVAELAQDLRVVPSFRYWIAEYFSPETYKYLDSPARRKKMKNAPFVFFPKDWMGFFKANGWVPAEYAYLADESLKLGREIPMPWWAKLIFRFVPLKAKLRASRTSAFVIYEPR